jgi:DNA-binding PadR family transcriptional regulator
MPERTLYAITTEGHRELAVLRDRFLRDVHLPADRFDLEFSVPAGLPAEDLRATVEDRVAALQGRITSPEHQRAGTSTNATSCCSSIYSPPAHRRARLAAFSSAGGPAAADRS